MGLYTWAHIYTNSYITLAQQYQLGLEVYVFGSVWFNRLLPWSSGKQR